MQLEEFMTWKGLSDEAVAEAVNVSRVSVVRYRNGERRPEWDVMARLYAFSGGLVDPNSFLVKIKRGKRRPKKRRLVPGGNARRLREPL